MALASPATTGARRPRRPDRRAGGGARRPDRPVTRAPRRGVGPPARRRRLVLAGRPAVPGVGSSAAAGRGSWTSTAPSTSTCTAASARCSPATPTRPSSPRSPSGSRDGTHFAQPVPDIIVVARELARRFGLPHVAVRQLRHRGHDGRRPPHARGHRPRRRSSRSRAATTGTTTPCRCPCTRTPTRPGTSERPRSVPEHGAVTAEVAGDSPLVVPFGDLDAVRRVLVEHPGEVAGMIVEPVMMNIGVVPPPPGYLDVLRRPAAPARRAARRSTR